MLIIQIKEVSKEEAIPWNNYLPRVMFAPQPGHLMLEQGTPLW